MLFVVWVDDRTIHSCFLVSIKSSVKAHLEHLKEDLEYALGEKFDIVPIDGSETEFEIKQKK